MSSSSPEVSVIGAGPAGLMAAEVLAGAGASVALYDHMPSAGRKLLMAGRGGLNLTHSEPLETFLTRYGAARPYLEPAIRAFPPEALVAWCEGLGQETFTGSSGRVFPRAMKASPLLRAWLARLEALGVARRMRHRWLGFADDGALVFAAPEGELRVTPRATLLALGGASWPRLGSDGGWVGLLPKEVAMAPLRPSNVGFRVPWSAIFRDRFQGQPLKRIALTFGGATVRGEAMVTAEGIEGGAVYALSAPLREAIAAGGPVVLHLDLRPDLSRDALAQRLSAPRRGQSLSGFLRRQAGLSPVAIGLVQEALHAGEASAELATLVKALPLQLTAPAPIARAISSAGGIALTELDARFMLRRLPGVSAMGEMLDWEAPTGGYLLQACFSTAVAAAHGTLDWLKDRGAGG
jgi:uncharacterized flavoprotein (TIGR03862 family)